MPTVKPISWHPDIQQKAAALKRRGLQIEAEAPAAISGIVGAMTTLAPVAIVLDLDKRPSSARDLAMVLGNSQSARQIPILFAGGLPEKIEDVRSWMPNAHFTAWAKAPEALRKLLEKSPSETRTTPSHRIYTTPLPKKLGIAADMQVALIAARTASKRLSANCLRTSPSPHASPRPPASPSASSVRSTISPPRRHARPSSAETSPRLAHLSQAHRPL